MSGFLQDLRSQHEQFSRIDMTATIVGLSGQACASFGFVDRGEWRGDRCYFLCDVSTASPHESAKRMSVMGRPRRETERRSVQRQLNAAPLGARCPLRNRVRGRRGQAHSQGMPR